MSTLTTAAGADRSSTASPRSLGKAYWIPTGLLCLVFSVSVLLSITDLDGSKKGFVTLGFPTFFVLPLAVAKAAGVIAVLSRRSRTLSLFAYAGFMYDMVLALAAHIHERDFPSGWLAVIGLVIWVAAFRADQRTFGRPRE